MPPTRVHQVSALLVCSSPMKRRNASPVLYLTLLPHMPALFMRPLMQTVGSKRQCSQWFFCDFQTLIFNTQHEKPSAKLLCVLLDFYHRAKGIFLDFYHTGLRASFLIFNTQHTDKKSSENLLYVFLIPFLSTRPMMLLRFGPPLRLAVTGQDTYRRAGQTPQAGSR